MTQRAKVMLQTHLRSNGFGERELVKTLAKVVNAANRGQYERLLPLPKGIDYIGRSVLSVREYIAVFHLDQFIDGGYQEYYA